MGYFSNTVINKTEYMTFDTFAVTDENRAQVQLAKQLAEQPRDFCCVFFCLPADQRLHLKYAMMNCWEQDCDCRAVNAAEFTEDLITALRDGNGSSVLRQYAQNEILIVDDLQFMASREATQEAFYTYVLKPRMEAGKVTVLFSQCSHKELAGAFRDDLHDLLRLGMHTEV